MPLVPARALSCACLLVACSAPAPAPVREQAPAPVEPPAQVAPPVVEAVKAEPRVQATAVEPAPVAEAGLGVASCDGFVDRYRACIDAWVPAAERDRHTKVLAAQVATWQAAKADPKLAAALDGECAAATEAARATTRILGCVWRESDAPEPELPKGGTLKPEVRTVPREVDLSDLVPELE